MTSTAAASAPAASGSARSSAGRGGRATTRAAGAGQWRKAIVDEVIKHDGVCCWVVVLEVQAMAGFTNDRSSEVLSIRKQGARLLKDVRVAGRPKIAVAAAEWDISSASDDDDWPSKLVDGASGSADGKKLTNGHRLTSGNSVGEDRGVEVTRAEEVDLDTRWVAWSDIPIYVRAEGRVEVRFDEIAAVQEEGDERGILREALQNDAIGDIWVELCERVGLDAAEGVTSMCVLVEAVGHSVDAASLDLEGQLLENIDLEPRLHHREGIAMRRLADAVAIVCEGAVAICVDSFLDVAVVVVVERQIPVRAVKANAVSEDLDYTGWSAVRLAVGCGNLSVDIDGGVAVEDLGGIVVPLATQVEDEVGHFDIVRWRVQAKDAISCRGGDRYCYVLALSRKGDGGEE